MNMLKILYMQFYDVWNLVIDAKYNPLRFIPSLVTQFYVTMILAIGWAAAFGMSLGYYTGIFTNVVVHVGVVFMVFFTASTFEDAERDGKIWWIEMRQEWQAHRK